MEATDRAVTSKTLDVRFENRLDASKWSVSGLDFEDWLDAVSSRGMTELHASQTEEFYFAIFRKGQYLIFFENDRMNAYSGSSTSLRAVDDDIAHRVWEKPSLISLLKWNVSFPSGGHSGQEVFTTWKIQDGFTGDMVLTYSVKADLMPYREVLSQKIKWSE